MTWAFNMDKQSNQKHDAHPILKDGVWESARVFGNEVSEASRIADSRSLDARGAVGPRHDIESILDAGEAAELAIAKLRQQGQETLVQQQVMYNKLRKFTDNPWVLTRSETNWSYLEIISRIHKKNFYEIIECSSSFPGERRENRKKSYLKRIVQETPALVTLEQIVFTRKDFADIDFCFEDEMVSLTVTRDADPPFSQRMIVEILDAPKMAQGALILRKCSLRKLCDFSPDIAKAFSRSEKLKNPEFFRSADGTRAFRFIGEEEYALLNKGVKWIDAHLFAREQKREENVRLLQQQLNTLELQQQTLSDQVKANEATIAYVTVALPLLESTEMPVIEERKGYYSLWFSGVPVFRIDDERAVSYIKTTGRSAPFRMHHGTGVRYQRQAEAICGLARGDFCNENSVKLHGPALDFAKEIFGKVERGVEIFPAANRRGYRIPIEEPIKPREEAQKRHWGQVFLSSLRPLEIIEGQLLGSGVAYRAYVFPENKVVVECDEEARATYLIRREQFESLRHWPRSRLLAEQPEGFEGRIIHPGETDGDRSAWQSCVEAYVKQ